MNSASLRWRLASGFVWVLIANLASQTSGFLRAVLPARILGIDAFGQYVTMQSILTMIASFAGLGLGTTATRYVSRLRETDPARAGRILGFCSILTILTAGLFTVLLLAFAETFSVQIFGTGLLAPELRLGSLFVFFFTINGYQQGALAGFEAFSTLAWVTLVQSIISVAVTYGATWFWQLPGAIGALGVTALASWLIHNHALHHQCHSHGISISHTDIIQEKRIFSEFAVPAALSGILGGLVTAGGSALLVRQPNGLAQAAIFGAATTIRTVALFAPGVLTRVTLPILSNLQGGQQERSYRKTFWAGLVLSGGFAFVAAAILFVATPLLLQWFGEEFSLGRIVVALALASAVLEVIGINLFQILYSYGRIWTHLAITSAWATIILSTTMILAPQYGARALAFSYLLAWASAILLYSPVVRALLRRRNLGSTHG